MKYIIPLIIVGLIIVLLSYIVPGGAPPGKDQTVKRSRMGMKIRRIAVGTLEGNCYIVIDEGSREAMIIDPGDEPDRIIDIIKEEGVNVRHIVCTHAHFDHVGAIPELKAETGASIVMHQDEKAVYAASKDMAAAWGFDIDDMPEPDVFVKEGDHITVGGLRFEVMHTPGHSPGSICLLGNSVLFSGDTVFAGSIGRTDFPGGSIELMKRSFKRVIDLRDDIEILSGHGPATTVGREKRENFFIHEL